MGQDGCAPQRGRGQLDALGRLLMKSEDVCPSLCCDQANNSHTHTHTHAQIFDSKTLFLNLVMEQDSVSYQTIMDLHKHIFFFFFASICSMQWWLGSTLKVHGLVNSGDVNSHFCSDWGDNQKIGGYSGCHNQFKRSYHVKVDEEGQKDITIIYLIVQTRVSSVQRNFRFFALFLSCNLLCLRQYQLLQPVLCLSILWECRHTPKLLNGQAKNSSGWVCTGWFMRLWVIQLCCSGMTAE